MVIEREFIDAYGVSHQGRTLVVDWLGVRVEKNHTYEHDLETGQSEPLVAIEEYQVEFTAVSVKEGARSLKVVCPRKGSFFSFQTASEPSKEEALEAAKAWLEKNVINPYGEE